MPRSAGNWNAGLQHGTDANGDHSRGGRWLPSEERGIHAAETSACKNSSSSHQTVQQTNHPGAGHRTLRNCSGVRQVTLLRHKCRAPPGIGTPGSSTARARMATRPKSSLDFPREIFEPVSPLPSHCPSHQSNFVRGQCRGRLRRRGQYATQRARWARQPRSWNRPSEIPKP